MIFTFDADGEDGLDGAEDMPTGGFAPSRLDPDAAEGAGADGADGDDPSASFFVEDNGRGAPPSKLVPLVGVPPRREEPVVTRFRCVAHSSKKQ